MMLQMQIVSTMANLSLEEVAAQANHPCLLFQLYVVKDRQLAASWVRKAEAAGYKALVVTVDAQRLGFREADERNRYNELAVGECTVSVYSVGALLCKYMSCRHGTSGIYHTMTLCV